MKKYKIDIDEEREISYTITKSNRRSIGISITLKDGVRLLVPKTTTKAQIEDVILKNSIWIIEKLQAMEAISSEGIEFREGELFPYLGKKYILQIIKSNGGKGDEVEIEEDYLKLYLKNDDDSENHIKAVIIKWYRGEANALLREKVRLLSEKTGLYPLAVKIKDQKSRFGSCSSNKNINLNWKLIMAPIEIIDYVIIHELCHLKEMNHSKDFWNLVESYVADYKDMRKWLKEKGGYIRLI